MRGDDLAVALGGEAKPGPGGFAGGVNGLRGGGSGDARNKIARGERDKDAAGGRGGDRSNRGTGEAGELGGSGDLAGGGPGRIEDISESGERRDGHGGGAWSRENGWPNGLCEWGGVKMNIPESFRKTIAEN